MGISKLSWKLSNTMDISLVTGALKEALALYPKPEIFNTYQGSQYTSKAYVNNTILKSLWTEWVELQIISVCYASI